MPNKTDRILGYLPSTFQTSPPSPALFAVVDAFGGELTQAESNLAAVMMSHWVDFADKNAQQIEDLKLFAALYGLTPRDDESIEEFRDHLKRYVRSFIEGTVTVQGVLRVAAEALGIRVADSYDELDTWWKRRVQELTITEPGGADAAVPLLGRPLILARGRSARSAQISGTVNPAAGSGLRLLIKIDALAPSQVNLAAGATEPTQIASAINAAMGQPIATAAGHILTLTAPSIGPASRLEILDVANDAASWVFGLAPRTFHGTDAQPAQINGTVDLSAGVTLGNARYLRLFVDDKAGEIDLTGGNHAPLTLDQVTTAINFIFPNVASHDGHFLSLTSPSNGFTSKITFGEPGGQSARLPLFGTVPNATGGLGPEPARVTGIPDLSGGVDLSAAPDIRVQLDSSTAVTINCAGADPSKTQLAEIVHSINVAMKVTIATHNGHNVTLTSTSTGASSAIVLESPPGDDAAQAILGIAPRIFSGAAETRAQIVGSVDLSPSIDVRTHPLLSLAVDQSPAVVVDLERLAPNPSQMSPADLSDAINKALGNNLASTDGNHLILTSPTNGAASGIDVLPPVITKSRRFATRAPITGEAVEAIFGASSVSAQGTAARSAVLSGTADLSHGVDLRVNRYLRLVVDARSPVEIDCAGERPRATLVKEIVAKINQVSLDDPASEDGRHLLLTSPSSGAMARIAIEPSRSLDALDILLGVAPGTYRGSAATGVVFVGLVDLSAGINLDPAAAINIAIDGGPATEVSLAGAAPNRKTIGDIVGAITVALKAPVARTDGLHLIIASPTIGAESEVAFGRPAGTDVTAQIFGIPAPRSYHGAAEAAARITGVADLSSGVNLQVAHNLRLGLDDRSVSDIDCSVRSHDPAHASLTDIVGALTLVVGNGVASHDGTHLIVTSRTTGPAAFIRIEPHTSGDASQTLLGEAPLGEAPLTALGQDAAPALVAGPPIMAPLDLSVRGRLRLSVDGGPPVDLEVAGAAPAKTSPAEIVAAINRVFPSLADLTSNSVVRLTSPSAGDISSVVLAPLRYLELIEYPPVRVTASTKSVSSGTDWSVVNRGNADTFAEPTITSIAGLSRPALVNRALGWNVRFLGILGAGERLHMRRDLRCGIRADILSATSERRVVPTADIAAGPLGIQQRIPLAAPAKLTVESDGTGSLQLDNPVSPKIIVLSARGDADPAAISINVTESVLVDAALHPPAAGERVRLIGRLETAATNGPQLLGALGRALAQVRSPEALHCYEKHVVIATGTLYAGAVPLLIVDQIAKSFRVTVTSNSKGVTTEESYPFVTVGEGAESDSLVAYINAGTKFGEASKLLKAAEYDKSTALSLPQGRSNWLYIDCEDSRFDEAVFNRSAYAGGACREQGVFDVSRFDSALFASGDPRPSAAQVGMTWDTYQAGAFTLDVPGDLPEKFGGRFNEARFGQTSSAPEAYEGAVTEPATAANPKFLVNLINGRPSDLIEATLRNSVPVGWTPVTLPFRKPQFLTGGDDKNSAKLYLADEGLAGFIELTAREPGNWGNQISISGRPSGPAIYDVSVIFPGARFENARQVAQGPDLSAAITDLLHPAPIGVLQAKAAGVRAEVIREGVRSATQQLESV
jgi:hypothetical protein